MASPTLRKEGSRGPEMLTRKPQDQTPHIFSIPVRELGGIVPLRNNPPEVNAEAKEAQRNTATLLLF